MDVIGTFLALSPFIIIVCAWRLRAEIIVGFSLITGLASAVIVRLVIGISHYGMGGSAPRSPDYFSYLAYTNLALILVSIGTLAWNHKEVETRHLGNGAILGIVFWVMLVAVVMAFFSA